MVTMPSLKNETSQENSTTTTTKTATAAAAAIITTPSHDGLEETTQAVYFTVSLTLIGVVVVVVCSTIFIWRRKRRTVTKDFSCYRDKNAIDDRDANRIKNIQASIEMFPCSTLDSRCSVSNSNDQNIRGDLLKKDINTDYGYCTITSLAEPLSSVHSYSSLNQPEALLKVTLYDTLQTKSNKSKAKTAANACKINAYDHVITERQQDGEIGSPATSTLENSSLRLKRGRRSNRKDTCRKDASELYNCTADSCFSKRYVVLESDGFYFANEETEA